MISYVLTALILPIFLYAFRVWRVSRIIAVGLYAGAVIGIVFVWTPALANILASMMGVGRGADLVIYVYCLLSFLLILDLSLKIKAQHQTITRIVREIAISRVLGRSERGEQA